MKIKSLLVAGLACLAMNAVAEDVTYEHNSKLSFPEDFKIEKEQLGQKVEVYVHALFDDSAYETEYTGITSGNIYLNMPEGLTVTYEEFNEDEVFALNARGKKFNPFGTPSCNTVDGQYRFIWADLTQTPMKENDIDMIFLELTVDPAFKGGDITVAEFTYMKPVDNADNIKAVLPAARVNEVLVSIPNPDGGGEVAVENINAGKAVAGVKYYNVAGQAADKAFDGVNVVVTTYADGTQSVAKVVK